MNKLGKGLVGLLITALIVGGGLSAGPADLDPILLRKAEREYALRQNKIANRRYITLVDYRRNILQKRLWLYDRRERRVVLNARVSHAWNSGFLQARSFSNTEGSEKSCIGTFLTQETYSGKFGYSLRLQGITPQLNSNTRRRAIIFHTDPGYRWSKGCFMSDAATNKKIIDLIQGGSLVYVSS